MPTVTVAGATVAATLSGKSIVLASAPALGALITATYDAPSGNAQVAIDDDATAFSYDTDDDWEGVVTAYVKVTCGGNWSAASEPVTTRVVQPPTCTAEPAGTLAADSACYGKTS